MMALEWDFAPLVAGLEEADAEYREVMDKGFARAGLTLVRRFQDQQLSGRRSDAYGLNIRTGNLHDSLRAVVTTERGMVQSTVYNQNATYWAYHQDGTGKIPKRLYLEEDFQDTGENLYASEVELAFQAVAG